MDLTDLAFLKKHLTEIEDILRQILKALEQK